MLARIAHELYWIGRYVARADDTARMLDGLFRASLQSPGGPDGAALPWESVMTALGAEPDPESVPVRATEAVRSLTLDSESPASVTACVERAREGTKRVRDVVSREMWQALNTLYLELDTSDLGSALETGPYSVYAFVRERCALWWGLADETMLRDQGYAYLAAGRHAEGASMMLRMLRVSIVPDLFEDDEAPVHSGAAPALLQAIGGLEAFRRSVAGPADAAPGRDVPALRAELSALGRGRRRAASRPPARRRPELPHRPSPAPPRAPARRARVPPPRRRRRGCGGAQRAARASSSRSSRRPTARSSSATSAAPSPRRRW